MESWEEMVSRTGHSEGDRLRPWTASGEEGSRARDGRQRLDESSAGNGYVQVYYASHLQEAWSGRRHSWPELRKIAQPVSPGPRADAGWDGAGAPSQGWWLEEQSAEELEPLPGIKEAPERYDALNVPSHFRCVQMSSFLPNSS